MAAYFADTSFWMALSRKRDQYHQHAVAWNQFVIRTRSSIVTTEAVLWEWLNGFSDASARGVAAEGYRRAHADARIEVVPFESELIDSAMQLYRTRPDKDWSLTDCLSFVVMERRHLTEALTTDGHFEQAGCPATMRDANLPTSPPVNRRSRRSPRPAHIYPYMDAGVFAAATNGYALPKPRDVQRRFSTLSAVRELG